jgi:hypothetical protein
VIVSLAAGFRGGPPARPPLDGLAPVFELVAVTAFVLAVLAVLLGVLLPASGDVVSAGAIARWPTIEYLARPSVEIQGQLLTSIADALVDQRSVNERKARWFRLSLLLLTAGISIAGIQLAIRLASTMSAPPTPNAAEFLMDDRPFRRMQLELSERGWGSVDRWWRHVDARERTSSTEPPPAPDGMSGSELRARPFRPLELEPLERGWGPVNRWWRHRDARRRASADRPS